MPTKPTVPPWGHRQGQLPREADRIAVRTEPVGAARANPETQKAPGPGSIRGQGPCRQVERACVGWDEEDGYYPELQLGSSCGGQWLGKGRSWVTNQLALLRVRARCDSLPEPHQHVLAIHRPTSW